MVQLRNVLKGNGVRGLHWDGFSLRSQAGGGMSHQEFRELLAMRWVFRKYSQGA